MFTCKTDKISTIQFNPNHQVEKQSLLMIIYTNGFYKMLHLHSRPYKQIICLSKSIISINAGDINNIYNKCNILSNPLILIKITIIIIVPLLQGEE